MPYHAARKGLLAKIAVNYKMSSQLVGPRRHGGRRVVAFEVRDGGRPW
jgi:hypothetical protein